jgi:predicted AlkP superfamily phosphohydrolase/phosphomutase
MIGLDGATFYLLDHLMAEGVMPFLKGLLEKSVRGDLMSTRNPLTPPAWISMVTGRSPHVHGIYDFLKPTTLADGSVFLKINDSREIKAETVWSMVSRQGLRATTLNFYGMAPALEINGYLASGFVPWKYLRKGMHPASLFDLVRSLPDFNYKNLAMDIGEEKKAVQGLMEGEHDEWLSVQTERDKSWTRLCVHLMQTDCTELTAVVLDGPDKVQHLFWRFVDPALAEAQPDEWWTRIRGLCHGFYRSLDDNIRKLFEQAGPDTNVIFTSDHGFGATTEVVYINEWLARNGYLKWADSVQADGSAKLTADKIKDHLGTVDWKRTIAFCPTPSSNAIYVKKARGRDGVGVKDSEYLDFCLKLRKELLDYRDPRDGNPVFVGADLNKLEGSPYVEPSPDVTLRLRDGGFVSILKSSEVVIPRAHADGTHRPNGIFIAHGPDFKQGLAVEPLDLLDITPLLLHLLGLPVPEDLEGRVPAAILRADAGQRRVEQAGATVAVQSKVSTRKEPTAEEREALLKQMKILGYMD